jgi:hypothetical protein
LGKKRWRFFGVFVFTFFAFLELGDLFGLASGIRSGQASASLPSVTAEENPVWLVFLALLALGLVLASLATAYALLTNAGWARYSAGVASALFLIYGVFQILGGFLFQDHNQTGLIFTGIMYILLGVTADWIARMGRPLARKAG